MRLVGTRIILEGRTRLITPKINLENVIPLKEPGFYNPLARLSRDISIGVYKAFSENCSESLTMADSLSGTGARGLRVATELPRISKIYMNDLNPKGLKLAEASANLNCVSDRSEFSLQEVCKFLIDHSAPGQRFNIVDIDPFGSPVPYLDCALKAITNGGLLSMTATDSAVLCGVHPKVSRRKYYGISLRTDYCHEVAVRLLIGSLAHTAMRLNFGIQPIFSHTSKHYLRTYVIINKGIAKADETLGKLGYINHCFICENRSTSTYPEDICQNCGGRLKKAGPLWLGEVHDNTTLDKMEKEYQILDMRDCLKITEMAKTEYGLPPTYYTIDKVSSSLKIRSPPIEGIIIALRNMGYGASRTIFNPKGIRTQAKIEQLKNAFVEAIIDK